MVTANGLGDAGFRIDTRALTFRERVALASRAPDLAPPYESKLPDILTREEVVSLVLRQTGLTRNQLSAAYCPKTLRGLITGSDTGQSTDVSNAEKLGGRHQPSSDLRYVTDALIRSLYPEEFERGSTALRAGSGPVISAPTLLAAFLERLVSDASHLLADTARFELNLALKSGLFTAQTGEECAGRFATLLLSHEYRRYFMDKYPMLIRRQRERMGLITAAWVSFAERLTSDRELIAAHFRIPLIDLCVTDVKCAAGESHNGAQTVIIVSFGEQRRLVYKPRSLSAEVAFQTYLAWINEICPSAGLRILQCLDRGEYGWMEFVANEAASSPREISSYYYRYGALIAAYNSLQGTDLHYENMIACRDQPMLIDLETIFHPAHLSALEGDESATGVMDIVFFAPSVYFTALVDAAGFTDGEQRSSPLSGASVHEANERVLVLADGSVAVKSIEVLKAEAHCLRYGARHVNALEYAEEIIEGFRDCYQAILRNRRQLLEGALERMFGDVTIRIVLKATKKYLKIIEAINSAYASEGYHRQDEYAQKLWLAAVSKPVLASVTMSEIEDVVRNDVPYFRSTTVSRDIVDSQGRILSSILARTGMAAVKERLCHMSLGAMTREITCIAQGLRPRPAADETAGPHHGRFSANIDQYFRNLNKELHYGDGVLTLVDLGFCRDVKTIRHLPLDNDLYNGLPGLCLALAYHGQTTGDSQSTTNAKAIADIYFERLDIEAHDFRIGACVGIGGWIWFATHLAALWNSGYYREIAAMLARRLMTIHWMDRHHDVFSGAAGAILAIDSLYSVSGDAHYLGHIDRLAGFLLEHSTPLDGGALAWKSSIPSKGPTTGFAHGASGIGYALLRAHDRLQDSRLLEAAAQVHKFLQGCFVEASAEWLEDRGGSRAGMDTWCHGAPGISLFYEKLESVTRDPGHLSALSKGLRRSKDFLIFGNESLCHGTLGNADVFLRVAASNRDAPDLRNLAEAALQEVQASLDVITEVRCGTAGKHRCLSLFNGLSGIGYQLLRLGHPEADLPSILTFDPAVHDR